ncbi:MAG: glycosyltransferase family 1 protein [Chloroflexi bacterium]|nr:glycosyltransferase family 1 protein [Chloroflexota bacterium]
MVFTETFLPRVDGIVNTLKWTSLGLLAAGWQPLIVAPAGNTQPLPGVRVLASPSIAFPLYPEVRLGFPTQGVWRAIDRFRPDVVHLAGPVTNGFGGLKYARSRGLPVISTYHTALPAYARLYGLGWLEDWAWSLLRAVHNSTATTLCPSRATLAELRARGFQRLALWLRGVDSSLFTPRRRSEEMRARLGARPDSMLMLFVGRLAREKKLERLVGAMAQLEGAHLALVGSGPQREQLQQLFDGLPVTFTGPLHGTELAAAYASADVFVFPSDTETFGNVVLEAMASALPVIATTVGGQVDLVQHARTGLLFAPEDNLALESSLRAYRDDPELRARHGQAGLQSARERTWARQVDTLIAHYESAINVSVEDTRVLTAA